MLRREYEGEAIKSSDALVRIKEFAAKNKQPSPEFRDLGESPRSTAKNPEFIVECRVMGKSASGTAQSKQEARILAAEKLLAIFAEEEKPSTSAKPRSVKKEKRARPTKEVKKPVAEAMPKNAKKSEKMASPKKRPFQHKKHL